MKKTVQSQVEEAAGRATAETIERCYAQALYNAIQQRGEERIGDLQLAGFGSKLRMAKTCAVYDNKGTKVLAELFRVLDNPSGEEQSKRNETRALEAWKTLFADTGAKITIEYMPDPRGQDARNKKTYAILSYPPVKDMQEHDTRIEQLGAMEAAQACQKR